jgi:hypothetical protein
MSGIVLKEFGARLRAAGCHDEVQVMIKAAGDMAAGVMLRYVMIKLNGREQVTLTAATIQRVIGISYKVQARVREIAGKAGLRWEKCRKYDGTVVCVYSIDPAAFWPAIDEAVKAICVDAPIAADDEGRAPSVADFEETPDGTSGEGETNAQTDISGTAQTAIPACPDGQSRHVPMGNPLTLDSISTSQEDLLTLSSSQTREEEDVKEIFQRREGVFIGNLAANLPGLLRRVMDAGMTGAEVDAFLVDMVKHGAIAWSYVVKGLDLHVERRKVAAEAVKPVMPEWSEALGRYPCVTLPAVKAEALAPVAAGVSAEDAEAWRLAKSQLRAQMERDQYQRWVEPTQLIAAEGGRLTLAARDQRGVDMLTHRLPRLLCKVAGDAFRRPVKFDFQMMGGGA